MTKSEILLITGATSGLGLRTVQHLAKTSHFEFIIGARQPDQAQVLQAVVPQERLTVLPLDLASLKSVESFAAAVIEYLGHRQLNAVALNAGIQITTGLEQSVDGVEKTFASNYLGHFYLMQELMPSLGDGAIAVLTASGTHDPQDRISRHFGFRGGIFPNVDAVADGILDTSVTQKQQCLDRYATSKLCLLLFLYESARRIPPSRVRFVAFDPGLMPGTELARDRGLGEQLAWKYFLPILGWFVPGVSSPKRSARTLSRLLINPAIAPGTGQHFDYRLKQTQTSVDSRRRDWQRNLYQKSLELCALDSSITP